MEILQQHVKTLKDQTDFLGNKCCDFLDEILKKSGENEHLRNIISENQIDIPDAVLDRAHPVGPVIGDIQCIIARFSNFRHRTLFKIL